MESENGKYNPISRWAEDDRPREKLEKKGKEALSDAELIAILLGSGSRNTSAVDLAKEILLAVNNDLDELGRLTIKLLSRHTGVGPAKAITVIAALELGRRRKHTPKADKKKVTSSKDVWDYMYPFLADLDHEEFYVLLLNRANICLEHHQISKGGTSATYVDVKLLFRKILEGSNTIPSSIIICHNHPSGNLNPSKADIDLTKKIKSAGQLLDITVLDHIIFTNESFYSLNDNGLM